MSHRISVRVKWLLIPCAIAAYAISAFAQDTQPQDLLSTSAPASGAGVSAQVPLPLMAERAGLPVPLSIVYAGGPRVGAAGLGWHVPLSYVHESATPAGRLPQPTGEVPLRVSLNIGGESIDLVPADATGIRFKARVRSRGLLLTKESSDTYHVHEGEARYVFNRLAGVNPDMFYLVRVEHAFSNSVVKLSYDVADRSQLPGSFEIRLTQILYNYLPLGQLCPASVVNLSYGGPTGADAVLDVRAPASSAQGYRPQIVTQVVTSVTISSRTDSCASNLITVARLNLSYDLDPDLQRPRLRGVNQLGKDGAGAALPVARYDYVGRTSAGGGPLMYDPDELRVKPVALPPGMKPTFSDVQRINYAQDEVIDDKFPQSSSGASDSDLFRSYYQREQDRFDNRFAFRYTYPAATVEKDWSAFVDMTGDGLPDLIFRSTADNKLKLARNTTTHGTLSFAAPVDLFAQGNVSMGPLNSGAERLPLGLRYTADVIGSGGIASTSIQYVRLMDMNGDGRPDIVDARYPGKWIAYINAPPDWTSSFADFNPSTSHPIYWMKTEIPMSELASHWRGRVDPDGDVHTMANGWAAGARMPLSWTLSGIAINQIRAYEFYGQNFQNGFLGCLEPSPLDPLSMPAYTCAWERSAGRDVTWPASDKSASYTIFDVTDVNGDSYPDFVAMDWAENFSFVSDFTPQQLELTVESECRTVPYGSGTECSPNRIVAPAQSPVDHYSSLRAGGLSQPDVKVLPRIHSIGDHDPSQAEIVIRQNYDAYLSCLGQHSATCPALTLSDYTSCYRWWGEAKGATTGNGPECYLEEVTVHWRGYARGVRNPGAGSPLHVNYNVAGSRLGPQSLMTGKVFAADAAALRNSSGACGAVQRWTTTEESGNERRIFQACGLVETNGDGVIDLLHVDGGVQMGTGDGFTTQRIHQEAGGISQVSRLPVCNSGGRRHPNYLPNPGETPQPQDPAILSYAQWLDRDGDGLPDSPLHLGSGGLKMSPLTSGSPLLSSGRFPPKPGCNDDATVTESLVDVTGDGRPDQARIVDGQLRIRQPAAVSADGATVSFVGLLPAGRLVRITDGFGAGVEYAYLNAKLDWWAKHDVPFAEIVLDRMTPIANFAAGLTKDADEPTYFAYGRNEMRYDTFAERFVPTGPLYTARFKGQKQNSGPKEGQTKGQGQIVTRWPYRGQELASREWLVGSPDQVRSYEGYFSNARDLLRQFMQATFDADAFHTGTRDARISYQQFDAAGGTVPASYNGGQCNRLDFPFGGLAQPGTMSASRYCASQGLVLVREEKEVEGFAYPAASTVDLVIPIDPAARNLQRTTVVEQFDDRGRPLRIKRFGDLRTGADDHCIHYAYAGGSGPNWQSGSAEYQPLGVLSKVSVDDCAGHVKNEQRFYYQNEPAISMEHFSGAPDPVRVESSFYDERAAKQWRTVVSGPFKYDSYGQLISSIENNFDPIRETEVRRTTTVQRDNFSLVPLIKRVSASDVAGYDLREEMFYEPGTYRLNRVLDSNTGVSVHLGYDRLGRPTTTAVSSPGHAAGAPQIVSATEYLGENSATHEGRKIRKRRFETWHPLASYNNGAAVANELWSEARYDMYGRMVRIDEYLGADPDYNNAKLSTWGAKYDDLGRLHFVTHPFVLGQSEGEMVSTYHHPELSTEPLCIVTAPGVHNSPATVQKKIHGEHINGEAQRTFALPAANSANDVSAQCSFVSYGGGKRQVLTIDPESLARSDDKLAFHVDVSDATGQIVERRAWETDITGNPVQQMRFAYDRYGRNTQVIRYRKPSLSAPAQAVTWSYQYDGLDRVTRFTPDTVSPIAYRYDDWGQLSSVSQGHQDPEFGVEPIDKGYEYDGFGRLKRWELLDDEGHFGQPYGIPPSNGDGAHYNVRGYHGRSI